jgi:hypothetical protein
MPLPTLNWRRLAPVNLAASTVNDMLDAIYTAGTAVTYANGSTRTPGVDCAWTWSRDTANALQPGATTAAWGTPPTSFPGVTNPGTVIPQTVIWSGSTAAPTATLQYTSTTSDARTANLIYVGQCKNPGAYSNWNSATPFTTGQFTGFATAAALPSAAAWGQMQMYESQEAVVVLFWRGAANVQTSSSIAGAFIDPGSASSSVSETDGRLYGLASSGSNNYNSATFLSATSDALFYEASVSTNSRCGFCSPGTATINGLRRFGGFTPGAGTLLTNGEIPLLPCYAASISTFTVSRLREIFIVRDLLASQRIQVGGVDYAYILGANWQTTAADALALKV